MGFREDPKGFVRDQFKKLVVPGVKHVVTNEGFSGNKKYWLEVFESELKLTLNNGVSKSMTQFRCKEFELTRDNQKLGDQEFQKFGRKICEIANDLKIGKAKFQEIKLPR